jgi:hypothetical protein
LGIVILKESEVPYFQKKGQILKKEIFFKNIGEELELTVRPYKAQGEPQIPLQEFQSTYISVPH